MLILVIVVVVVFAVHRVQRRKVPYQQVTPMAETSYTTTAADDINTVEEN